MWMQDECKVYMNSYMASNGSCFMVTWIIFKNHLLKVGLTQNRGLMALRTLTTSKLFYFIMCDDPREQTFIEIAFGWGPGHIWLHTTLEDPWPHYMTLEVCWGSLRTLSSGLSQFHGHFSWLVCEVALIVRFISYPRISWCRAKIVRLKSCFTLSLMEYNMLSTTGQINLLMCPDCAFLQLACKQWHMQIATCIWLQAQ